MNDNLDFKLLWKEQKSEIPNVKEVIENGKKYKRKQFVKLLFLNSILLLTSVFIAFIWYFYQPERITTKIGIIIVIFGMLVYLFIYNKMIPFLNTSKNETDATTFLKQLLELKQKQYFLQNIMTKIYFVLLAIGLGLYMIEYVMRMKLVWGICFYVGTLFWICFNWFFIHPRKQNKENLEMNNLIKKFEDLKNQLD